VALMLQSVRGSLQEHRSRLVAGPVRQVEPAEW
jgi:hypothetical protein